MIIQSKQQSSNLLFYGTTFDLNQYKKHNNVIHFGIRTYHFIPTLSNIMQLIATI